MPSARTKYMESQLYSRSKMNNRGVVGNIISNITSIISGGKSANVQVTNDSEMRSTKFALPYGIASSGFKGMGAQVINNSDGSGNTIVGTIDSKRPDVKPGELILYTRDGTQIKLDNNGNIEITCNSTIKINGDTQISGNLSISGTVSASNIN